MGFFVSEIHRDFNILSALSVFKTEGVCSGPLTDVITECFFLMLCPPRNSLAEISSQRPITKVNFEIGRIHIQIPF